MRLLFNLTSFHTKFALFILTAIVFFALYNTLPAFDIQAESIWDKIFFTISMQVANQTFKPKSIRGKIISTIHMIIGYVIALL